MMGNQSPSDNTSHNQPTSIPSGQPVFPQPEMIDDDIDGLQPGVTPGPSGIGQVPYTPTSTLSRQRTSSPPLSRSTPVRSLTDDRRRKRRVLNLQEADEVLQSDVQSSVSELVYSILID